MAYVYRSLVKGIFNFTIPGENKTVTLFKNDEITLKNPLNGTYLRVFEFVKEIKDDVEVDEKTKLGISTKDKVVSVVEEPKKEEPKKEEPVKEELVKEELVKEELVKEEPVKEEPVKEEPVKEEPVKEEPVKEEPVKEEPVKEEPKKRGRRRKQTK
jgi:hypothetical protein